MPYPTYYTRQYDFVTFQNGSPNTPLPADKVNADYNFVEQSIDEIIDFIKLFTRSDGVIANGVVGRDQLSDAILTLIDAANGSEIAAGNVTYDNSTSGLAATTVQAALDEIEGAAGLNDIVEDTTPQLGGNLDLNGFVITGLEIGTDVQAWDAQLDSLSGATANGVSLVTAANYAAMRTLLDLEAGTDFYSIAAADAAFQPLDADLTSIAALATTAAGRSVLTIADPGADRIVAWDDTAGAMAAIALADLTDEASPATGDYVLIYGAEGDLRKADWSTLPGSGGGIANVSEDTTPSLGGPLDGDGFDLNDMGVLFMREQAAAEADVAGQGQIWVKTATPNELWFTDDAGTDFAVLVDADIGVTVQAYDADTAKLDVADQTITGGARVTTLDDGTKSSGTYTPDPGDRPMIKIINGGAFTLAPGTNVGAYLLDITNNGSAGAITTSGWTKVVGSFGTTNGHKYRCHCSIGDAGSLLTIQAMQ